MRSYDQGSTTVEESLKKLRARINEITTAQLRQPDEDKDNFLQALNSPTKVARIESDIQVEDLRALPDEKEIIELTEDFFEHYYGGIERRLFDGLVLNQEWVKHAAILFAEISPSVKWLKFDVSSEPTYFTKVCDQLKSIVPSHIKIYFYNHSAASFSAQYSNEDNRRMSYMLLPMNSMQHDETGCESTTDPSQRYNDETPAETDDEDIDRAPAFQDRDRNKFRNALLIASASNRVRIESHTFRVGGIKSISPDIKIVELMRGFFIHYKIHTVFPKKSSAISYLNAGHTLLASIPDTVKWLVFDHASAMYFGPYYYGIILDVLKDVTPPHVTIYINHKTHEDDFELLRIGKQSPILQEGFVQYGETPSMLEFLSGFTDLAISHKKQSNNIQVIPTPHQINATEFVAPAAATPEPLRVRPLNKKRRALCEEKKRSMVDECVRSLIAGKKKEVDAREIFKRFFYWSTHFYKKVDEAATGKSRAWKITENKENVHDDKLSSEEDRRQCIELAESMTNEALELIKNLIKNHPALQGEDIQFVNTQRMVAGDDQDFSREQSSDQAYRSKLGVKCGGSQPRLDQMTQDPTDWHDPDPYVPTLFYNASTVIPKPAPIPVPSVTPAETAVPQLQAGFARFHSGKAPLDGVPMSRKQSRKQPKAKANPSFHVNLTHLPDATQKKIKENEMAKLKRK